MRAISQTNDAVNIIRFPDGQTHVGLRQPIGGLVSVEWRIRNADELFTLVQLADALDAAQAEKHLLIIPYLMGARWDRRIERYGSFDLKVVADIINRCGFSRVQVFEPHSDVATALINNSRPLESKALTSISLGDSAVLICPDAGAMKRSKDLREMNSAITDTVYCAKQRATDGFVALEVLDPEKCRDRDCVIVDDICDGGATFLCIADQIKPRSLTLVVSHGIFSKGFQALGTRFNRIVTTDSFQAFESRPPFLTVLPFRGEF